MSNLSPAALCALLTLISTRTDRRHLRRPSGANYKALRVFEWTSPSSKMLSTRFVGIEVVLKSVVFEVIRRKWLWVIISIVMMNEWSQKWSDNSLTSLMSSDYNSWCIETKVLYSFWLSLFFKKILLVFSGLKLSLSVMFLKTIFFRDTKWFKPKSVLFLKWYMFVLEYQPGYGQEFYSFILNIQHCICILNNLQC